MLTRPRNYSNDILAFVLCFYLQYHRVHHFVTNASVIKLFYTQVLSEIQDIANLYSKQGNKKTNVKFSSGPRSIFSIQWGCHNGFRSGSNLNLYQFEELTDVRSNWICWRGVVCLNSFDVLSVNYKNKYVDKICRVNSQLSLTLQIDLSFTSLARTLTTDLCYSFCFWRCHKTPSSVISTKLWSTAFQSGFICAQTKHST